MLVRPKVSGPIVVVLAAMAAAAVLAGVVGVTGVTATPHLLETTEMIRALAAPAFVVAGVLRLARWRITGESHCGLRGLAMVLMGGISMPSATLVRSLSDPSNALATVTCVRALTVGTILYVMAAALSDDAPDRAHLERKIGWLAGTTAAVLVLLALSQHRRLPPEPTLQLALARGVVLALAIGWFTVAVGAVAKGRREDWAKPLAPLLATMGIAELFRLPARPETALVAVALTATVAFLAAIAAVVDLVRAAQEENDATQYLSRELADVRGEVVSRDARHDDLTHDARSTLAGIRAAMYTLDRHADELDQTTADRLRVATLAELTHLEHMLVGTSLDGDVFDVTEVVRTVTDVRRAAGLRIDVALRPGLARGVPGDVATALQNLLVNAHEHAPGARVSVEVRTAGELVQVTVSDDGPGMPSPSAASLFDRGVSGPESRGSGLGLSIARELVRRQGGELELGGTATGTATGTTFVISLPSAASFDEAGSASLGVAS